MRSRSSIWRSTREVPLKNLLGFFYKQIANAFIHLLKDFLKLSDDSLYISCISFRLNRAILASKKVFVKKIKFKNCIIIKIYF